MRYNCQLYYQLIGYDQNGNPVYVMVCNPGGTPVVNSQVYKTDYVTCLDQS
jgi:hypothetical protein